MTRTYPRYDLRIPRIGSGWIYKDAHFMYLGFGSSRLFWSIKRWLHFLVLYSSALKPRAQHTCSAHLCLLYSFTYLIQLRHKAPAGAVILGHLGRSVRVTDQTVYIYCDYHDYDTEIRVKVRSLHHKVD